MAKVGPDTPIEPGGVIVRVGSNALPCPKGRKTAVYPVIQLVWASGEPDWQVYPSGRVMLRWQRREDDDKPVRHITDAKYVRVYDPERPRWGVTYRVSPKDRDEFAQLQKEWGGLWFFQTGRQDYDDTKWFCYFDDGFPFLGRFAANIETYVLDHPKSMRMAMVTQWVDAVSGYRTTDGERMGPTDEEMEKYLSIIKRIPDVLEKVGGGSLPWIPKDLDHWGKPDRNVHDQIVNNYLILLNTFSDFADNEKNSEGRRKEFRYMWQLMRKAKIFEIADESFLELHMEVDRYCTEEIAQLKFYDPRETDEKPSEEEGALLYKRQTEALERLPFPSKMPFDVCWFAISGGIGLSDHQQQTRGIKKKKHDVRTCLLVGMLVTEDGEFHEVMTTTDKRGRAGLLMVTHRVSPQMSQPWMEEMRTEKAPTDHWHYPFCLAPFILHKIIDCINEHQTVIVAQRRLSTQVANRLRKGMRTPQNRQPTPPPFYTVYLKDKTIKEMVRQRGVGVSRATYGHRFDVRGHWCYRVYRGPLPMDPAEELKLEKLKYEIYKNRPLDSWVKETMRERGLPPRHPGEWIAVKRWWRDSFVKGPDDAEYIPSTRRASKGPLAFDNRSHRRENDGEAA